MCGGVTFFPLDGGQVFPFGEGSESKSREQEKGGKSTLNENCEFDCEQIADRLPNTSRQLFMPGETRFRLYIIRGENRTLFE